MAGSRNKALYTVFVLLGTSVMNSVFILQDPGGERAHPIPGEAGDPAAGQGDPTDRKVREEKPASKSILCPAKLKKHFFKKLNKFLSGKSSPSFWSKLLRNSQT